MNEERTLLERATALADAATEGPWEADVDAEAVATERDLRGICHWMETWDDETQANMRFIAAARTLVPELVTRVADLEAERDAAFGVARAQRINAEAHEANAHDARVRVADLEAALEDGIEWLTATAHPRPGWIDDARRVLAGGTSTGVMNGLSDGVEPENKNVITAAGGPAQPQTRGVMGHSERERSVTPCGPARRERNVSDDVIVSINYRTMLLLSRQGQLNCRFWLAMRAAGSPDRGDTP